MWCILTVGALANKDLSPVVEAVVDHEEDRQRDTEESIFAQALLDEAFDQLADDATLPGEQWGGLLLPVSNVRDRFDNLTDRDVSASYIGQLRNRVGLSKVRHSDGTKINDPALKPKLEQLTDENGVDWSPSPGTVEDVHTVEIETGKQKHSLERENDKPSQEDRRDTLTTVCEMLQADDEPLSTEHVAEVAAGQIDCDAQTLENELRTMLPEDRRFERFEDGNKLKWLP
jgi:hypothetical protein